MNTLQNIWNRIADEIENCGIGSTERPLEEQAEYIRQQVENVPDVKSLIYLSTNIVFYQSFNLRCEMSIQQGSSWGDKKINSPFEITVSWGSMGARNLVDSQACLNHYGKVCALAAELQSICNYAVRGLKEES